MGWSSSLSRVFERKNMRRSSSFPVYNEKSTSSLYLLWNVRLYLNAHDLHSMWVNLWQRGWETHSSLLIQTCVKAITCIRGVLLHEFRLPWGGRRESSLASRSDGDRGDSLAALREVRCL